MRYRPYMSTVATFESSLEEYAVETTRVSPDEFPDALADTIEEPAVGARLPLEGVSLEGTSVALNPSPADLDAAVTGVTSAQLGIADYGSLVLESSSDGSEPVSLFCDHHVAVLAAENLVPDMSAAFDWMATEVGDKRESAIIATGPSATADMGALVQGVHGPQRVDVLIVES
jgi:L-lactate dehydrogenase complex protein LldG